VAMTPLVPPLRGFRDRGVRRIPRLTPWAIIVTPLRGCTAADESLVIGRCCSPIAFWTAATAVACQRYMKPEGRHNDSPWRQPWVDRSSKARSPVRGDTHGADDACLRRSDASDAIRSHEDNALCL
jgi:hypothetical protein